VVADDAAGNVSAKSASATVTPVAAVASAPGAAVASSGFVARSGQQLLLNGLPFRFVGFNLWRANVTSWNQPPSTGYDLNDGTTLDTTLKDIKATGPKLNVFRAWFMQQFALHNGAHTGAYDWSAFDKTLQVAQANGFKVIAVLDDQWSYETDGTDSGSGWLPSTWYQTGYKTGPFTSYEYYSYRQFVQDVVSRYKNNPAILAWEMVNEPEVASSDGVCVSNSESIMASFVHDIGGLIKSIDPNHLVSLGASGNGMCGTIEGDYQTVMSDPSIDLCSFHDYYGPTNITANNTWNGLNVRIQQCGALNKPVYVGEMGIHSGATPCNGDLTCRASYLGQKLAAAFAMPGVVGYLPWQFDDRGSGYNGDDYNYGPGDPGIATLSSYGL
jgi:endo-1,4-beta-mannosidase